MSGRSTLPENRVLHFRRTDRQEGPASSVRPPFPPIIPSSESIMKTVTPSGPPAPRILTLPIAAAASARTRFIPSQPSAVKALLPQDALRVFESCLETGSVDGIEIAGPGDPLASMDATLTTLQLIAENSQALSLSLLTLGIGLDQHADVLRKAGLSQVKIQVDAVDPFILEQIYLWIRPGKKTLPLPAASRLLVEEQARAVPACKEAGLKVIVVTTVYPETNSEHLEVIARTMAEHGADSMILIPFQPEEGADITLPAADAALMAEAEKVCALHLPVMVRQDVLMETNCQATVSSSLPRPTKARPNVAVASSGGLDVDLHLGQAKQLLIYGPREDGLTCLLEIRPAPLPGGPGKRWQILAATLPDCCALLAASAGETPRAELAEAGITVLITEDSIEGIVDVLYGGGKKGKQCRK